MKPHTDCREGMTLIEVLVVMSIIGLMSGVLLAYNRESERQLVLQVDQARVVGLLSRAKSFALGKYAGLKAAGPTAGERAAANACAFGVRFVPDAAAPRLILFQDLPQPANGQCLVSDGMGGMTATFNATYDGDMETVDILPLDPRVVIEAPLAPGGDVVFEAPYLKTYFNGALIGDPTGVPLATITLGLPDGSASKDIQVGSGGQILSL
jgi:prepilin-type N-terminal cleavage/methylation domain-containing protein